MLSHLKAVDNDRPVPVKIMYRCWQKRIKYDEVKQEPIGFLPWDESK